MAVLEASVDSKARENMKNDKKNVKKVLVVAQELKLARVLAGNNKTARDRALKSLRKWFENRSSSIPFTEDDFLRLWKGLFYSMWMSDKPLIQEECAENISNLVHCLPPQTALLFYKCGTVTLINEWFGIDQHRIDKFLMFVRRLLRQALFVLKNQKWNKLYVNTFTGLLSETILKPQEQKPMGLLLHFIEIFLEELAKVSDGELPPHLVTELLKPFIKEMAYSDDRRIIHHIRSHIFLYLMRQSDLGIEYEEKYKAWRTLGFPGSIDSMKKIEVSDDEQEEEEETNEESIENSEKVYDPRAGKVDVTLPQIKFHPKAIVKALSDCKFEKMTNSKSRKCISELIEHFKKMSSGVYPLGVKKLKLAKNEYDTNIRKAANRLIKFDQKIKGKSKRQKRKIDNDDEIELRGGKRIKLNNQLKKKIQEDFNAVIAKKRKTDQTSGIPKKVKKKEWEVECLFKRNSGTWLVTKIAEESNEISNNIDLSENKIKFPKNYWDNFDDKTDEMESLLANDLLSAESSSKKIMFPKNTWDSFDDKTIDIETTLKKKRLSLPTELLKNPFANSTPVKKVKINTKLNRSQDVREHRAQILSSPAIPYDANKKPAKPLLKTPTVNSPINPFASFGT